MGRSKVSSLDLNADLGEGVAGELDEALLGIVTSASVACGFHAGDPEIMRRTIEAAAARGVTIGAHPSYSDRAGFGRVDLQVEPERLRVDVLYQIGALDAVARACGSRVRYVKPHGALYNRIHDDEESATAVCRALVAFGEVELLVGAGSVALEVAGRLGLRSTAEVFADRAYLSDGRLAPRTMPGSLVSDPSEAARRAVALATEHRVHAVDGARVELEGSSICVHGDTPGALEIATEIRSALTSAGVTLAPFAS